MRVTKRLEPAHSGWRGCRKDRIPKPTEHLLRIW